MLPDLQERQDQLVSQEISALLDLLEQLEYKDSVDRLDSKDWLDLEDQSEQWERQDTQAQLVHRDPEVTLDTVDCVDLLELPVHPGWLEILVTLDLRVLSVSLVSRVQQDTRARLVQLEEVGLLDRLDWLVQLDLLVYGESLDRMAYRVRKAHWGRLALRVQVDQEV